MTTDRDRKWAAAWHCVLRRGYLTSRQLREAEEFAEAAMSIRGVASPTKNEGSWNEFSAHDLGTQVASVVESMVADRDAKIEELERELELAREKLEKRDTPEAPDG